MDQEKIGYFIATLRKEKNLTQAQFGELLGVSQRTVSRWETGRNMPDISLLPSICEVLEIHIAELMAGEPIKNEEFTKTSASHLADALIALTNPKRTLRHIICGITALVLTIIGMVALYQNHFFVDVSTTADLEQAINEYHFTDTVSADILERAMMGKYLFVLFRQNDHPTAGGIAQLEKGIFGKYRFVEVQSFNWTLGQASRVVLKKEPYLLLYGINDLPEIAYYQVYDNWEKTGTPIYKGQQKTAPYLSIIKATKEIPPLAPWCIRYFDAAGNEIPENVLSEKYPEDSDAVNGGTTTAELGSLYFYEIVLLWAGGVLALYFLNPTILSDRKKRIQK